MGSPKREASEAELLNIEEARSKALRVSCVVETDLFEKSLNHVNTFICQVNLKNGNEIPIEPNVEPSEKEFDLIAKEPLLWYEPEFQKELVIEGMKKELECVKEFDVYDEVTVGELSPEELRNCIPTRWVHKPKGLAIKSRIVVKGYKEIVEDKDDTFASTPSVITLRLLLVIALSKNW